MTFERNQDMVKMNHATYLCQRSFRSNSKSLFGQTESNTSDRLLYLDHSASQ